MPLLGNILRFPAQLRVLPVRVRTFYARCVSWSWRMLVRRGIVVDVPGVGWMRLNPGDLIPSRLVFYGTWEPVMTEFVRGHAGDMDGSVAIDVGANIGYYTLLLSRMVGASGRVYAIEPAAVIRRMLEENVALNGLRNVAPVGLGISDRPEARAFHLDARDNLGASRFGEVEAGGLELRRLRDVIAPEDAGRVALIKIDVEGMEYAVLRDLLDRLEMFPALRMILAEVRVDAAGAMNALLGEFRARGFERYVVPNRYDHESYAAGVREAPYVVQEVGLGEHDVALLRRNAF